MKILIYADLHGNVYALDELQKTEDYQSADLRIFSWGCSGKMPFF